VPKHSFRALMMAVCFVAVAFSSAQALDRRLRIQNSTDYYVFAMYVSNVGDENWGPDQLRDGLILPRHYMWWNIDDGSGYCRFDFKFVMSSSRSGSNPWYTYKTNYNVCPPVTPQVGQSE
jgi:hypothetical protein